MLFPSNEPGDDAMTVLLGLVPTLPTEVSVTCAEAGDAKVLLADVDRGHLIAYGPQSLMQDGLALTLPLRDSSGGGSDVVLRVQRAYYQVGDQTMLHLVPESVEYRAGHRESPRYVLDEAAEAFALQSKTAGPQSFHVRVADLSATGFAFLTELELAVNDTIMLTVSLGERPVTVEGRVRRIDAAPLRNRIACDINSIREWDRASIVRLAAIQEEVLSRPQADRHPEIAEARAQSRREQHQLQVRMALRRFSEG